MRVKTDFVTNSSSSSFIIATTKESLPKVTRLVKKYNAMEEASNEGVRIYQIFKDHKALFEYTHGFALDWVSECKTPCFENMAEEHFILCKKEIEEGSVLVYISVDYNVCEDFDYDIKKLGNRVVDYD